MAKTTPKIIDNPPAGTLSEALANAQRQVEASKQPPPPTETSQPNPSPAVARTLAQVSITEWPTEVLPSTTPLPGKSTKKTPGPN